jgi:hypothetical protein
MKEKATHVNHHYVPDFLLRAWHAQPQNKLVQYSWVRRGLDIRSRSAKAVAKQAHLYSSTSTSGEKDVKIEKEYFGPEIDDKAAPVMRKLIEGGREALDDAQSEAWAKFLIAQMVRVPSMIASFSAFAQQEFSKGAQEIASRPGRASFIEYAQMHEPHAGANAAVEMLETVIGSGKLNGAILNASWQIFKLDNAKFDLLIGDNPLIRMGPMASNFLVALPLGPRVLYVAASDPGTLTNIENATQTEVVSTLNKDSVSTARKYVYARDTSQTVVVKKHLRKPS